MRSVNSPVLALQKLQKQQDQIEAIFEGISVPGKQVQ